MNFVAFDDAPSAAIPAHPTSPSSHGHWLRSSEGAAAAAMPAQRMPGAGTGTDHLQHVAARAPASSLFDVPPGYRTIASTSSPTGTVSPAAASHGNAEPAGSEGRVTRLRQRSMLQAELGINTQGDTGDQSQLQSQLAVHEYAAYPAQPVRQVQQNTFVAPAVPLSAPPAVSQFVHPGSSSNSNELRNSQQLHQQVSLHRSAGPSRPKSGERATGFMSPIGYHSRSSSVSSTSTMGGLRSPHYRSHSQSVSSSTSSSLGDSASSSLTATGRRVNRLTNLDRKELCIFAAEHPRMKHDAVAQHFNVERSTVSKILKNKAKWLTVNDDNTLASPSPDARKKMFKPRAGRHPELEMALIEWGRERTRQGDILTDERIRMQALEVAKTLSIAPSAFKASSGWLENFKERAEYSGGIFALDTVPLYARHGQEESSDSLAAEEAGEEDENETTVSPLWRSDASSSHAPSTSGWTSPLELRSRMSGSLAGSASSLPGLIEEDSSEQQDMTTNSSSRSGIRPMRSSYAVLQRAPSYSSDSSPLPSPTCSMGDQSGQMAMMQSQMVTPTQQSTYGYHGSQAIYSHGQRLHQAGINFNINLNSTPLQPMETGHPMEYNMQRLGDTEGSHVKEVPYDALSDERNTRAAYALRSRMQSASQVHAQQQQQLHQQQQLQRQHQMQVQQQQSQQQQQIHHQQQPQPQAQPQQQQQRIQNSLRTRQPTYPHVETDDSHPESAMQMQNPSPERIPLHRSHTAPMPGIEALTQQRAQAPVMQQHQSMSAHMPEHLQMQVDQPLATAQPPTAPLPNAGQIVTTLTASTASAGYHRRATISTTQDPLLQHPPNPYGYPGAANFVAGTPPSMAWSDKVTFEEAFIALRKVVGFLSDRQASVYGLAGPDHFAALETLLRRFRDVHHSVPPVLTPPNSQ